MKKRKPENHSKTEFSSSMEKESKELSAASQLFLLYLIGRTPERSESELLDLCLQSLYMDYFTFIECLGHLKERELVYVAERKGESRKDSNGSPILRISLSEKGIKVLSALESDIPMAVKRNLELLISEKKEMIEAGDTVFADIKALDNSSYRLDLRLIENREERFHLSVELPDRLLCKRIAKKWKASYENMYVDILKILDN